MHINGRMLHRASRQFPTTYIVSDFNFTLFFIGSLTYILLFSHSDFEGCIAKWREYLPQITFVLDTKCFLSYFQILVHIRSFIMYICECLMGIWANDRLFSNCFLSWNNSLWSSPYLIHHTCFTCHDHTNMISKILLL